MMEVLYTIVPGMATAFCGPWRTEKIFFKAIEDRRELCYHLAGCTGIFCEKDGWTAAGRYFFVKGSK